MQSGPRHENATKLATDPTRMLFLSTGPYALNENDLNGL